MPSIHVERVAASSGDDVHRPIAVRMRLGEHGEHLLLADAYANNQGNDLGPDAHDLYDCALAACKAVTVLWAARRKGIPVTDLALDLASDRSREREGTYAIDVRLAVSGPVTPEQVAQLQAIADKCPVHKLMTLVTTQITTTVRAAGP
jgi:putative redox protein